MPPKNQSNWLLVLIGVGKLLKAALLVFVAVKAHELLLSKDVASTVHEWVHAVRIDPGNKFVHAVIGRLIGISPKKMEAIRLGSFLYAALFATEGTGLVLRKRWAEYFTTITTSLLIPLEVYEVIFGHHHLAAKIVVLLINAAIVVYLIVRLRAETQLESKPRGAFEVKLPPASA